MIKNDGSVTNESRFWETFCNILGENARDAEAILEDFYKNEFQAVKNACGFSEESKKIVDSLKARGIRVILATNPIFPKIATDSRIRWAGMSPDDFELVTTFENSCYTKPNPKYYENILGQSGLSPDECVMVGNDVSEDMVAKDLGMGVFLLTNDLINKKGADVSVYPSGGFAELIEFLNNI
jgi:FMN phosphatase YigB (HAD superfamily)